MILLFSDSSNSFGDDAQDIVLLVFLLLVGIVLAVVLTLFLHQRRQRRRVASISSMSSHHIAGSFVLQNNQPVDNLPRTASPSTTDSLKFLMKQENGMLKKKSSFTSEAEAPAVTVVVEEVNV